MKEQFLHYVWFHKLFTPQQFTVDGRAVEILNVGVQNYDEGPDAFGAKIKIDGILWVGNIELHIKTSHWYTHKHSLNPHYSNVILHVVVDHNTDQDVFNGHSIPTLQLNIPSHILDNYNQLFTQKSLIPCSDKLPIIDTFHLNNSIETMAVERIRNKAKRVEEMVSICDNNIEQTFFVLLARSFGFSVNGDAMQAMAMSFPHNIIFKIADNRLQLEALMMGQANILCTDISIEYVDALQREYSHLKSKYNLQPLPIGYFKLLRLRPYNFPWIRISQLVDLITHTPLFFQQVLEADNIDRLRKIFFCQASEFWDTHYSLNSSPSAQRLKQLSSSSIDGIIINTIVPFLFFYANKWNNQAYADRAMNFLESMPPEKNNITNKFVSLGFNNENALCSQGIIECYRAYCQQNNCLRCPLSFYYIKKKHIAKL